MIVMHFGCNFKSFIHRFHGLLTDIELFFTAQGATASPATYDDPFGMGAFTPTKNPQELDVAIQNVDNELMDLQVHIILQISRTLNAY